MFRSEAAPPVDAWGLRAGEPRCAPKPPSAPRPRIDLLPQALPAASGAPGTGDMAPADRAEDAAAPGSVAP
jgi:hypothetical protein